MKPYAKLPKTATYIEGETVEMECIVYGLPPPTINWRFGMFETNNLIIFLIALNFYYF